MIHERLWNSGGVILTEETEGLGEKPVPVPLCPAQILHELNTEQTNMAKVSGPFLGGYCGAVPESYLEYPCSQF
jgi:hypothetical protein